MNRDTAIPSVSTPPPGPHSRKWTQTHMKHAAEGIYFHDVVWDRSKPAIGPFFTDPDGNLLLDMSSHGAAFPLGYNHPELIQTAVKAARVCPDKSGAEIVIAWGDDPAASEMPTPTHLIQKLSAITSPHGLDTMFLSNSGSEAIENSLKVCYEHRRNMGIGICFDRAFHGRTLGAASLTRSRRGQRAWYPHIPDIVSLPFCRCKGSCQCGWRVKTDSPKGEISRLAELLDPDIGVVDPDQVAFIILEPVQGEGGYRFPSPDFIKEVETLAKQHKIPLIADEIQSGMGRTGKWFAFEHFNITPDVVALGKSLRVGATVARKEMFSQMPGRLGGTWGGADFISSAVGCKVMEIMERDHLLDHVTRTGAYFLEGLKSLENRYEKVENARGLGLMLAVTVKGQGAVDKVVKEALKKGLLLFSCGFDSIRFMPTLDLTKREVDLCLNILDDVFAHL